MKPRGRPRKPRPEELTFEAALARTVAHLREMHTAFTAAHTSLMEALDALMHVTRERGRMVNRMAELEEVLRGLATIVQGQMEDTKTTRRLVVDLHGGPPTRSAHLAAHELGHVLIQQQPSHRED